MSSYQPRRPAGVPTGGQFATKSRPEPGYSLEGDEDRPSSGPELGDVSNVREGSRTPWGAAQGVSHTAPGVVQVSTAGHGGVKLSPERNKMIHPALRNASGWYEEDCEAGIAVWAHPDAFPRPGKSVEEVAESGRQTVVDWFPDGYEKVTGETIQVGVSYVKDERLWQEAHANDEVAVSAIRSSKFADFTEVTVRRGGRDGDTAGERVLMVPSDEYNDPANRHPLGKASGSFVVDPARRYADITPEPAPPKPPRPRYREIDTSRLTATQAERAERDLDQRWRMPDGSVKTLREVVASGGVSGKWRSAEYGYDGRERNKYYLSLPAEAEGAPQTGYDTHAAQVSKATWDAMVAPES